MSSRDHTNVIIIVGGRGSGKTTLVRKLIAASPLPKKLVVDTFFHPSYRDWEQISIQELSAWRNDHRHLSGSDFDKMFKCISLYVRNTFVVFEDSAKMIDANPQRMIKEICLDSKQKNNDVIFVYHSLGEVPPRLFKWADYIEIFKTQEVIENQKSRIFCYERLVPLYRQVMKSSDPYCHKTLQLY